LTGLRRKELASLTRSDFRLDDLTPTVRIQGAYSKNKKTDEIPLHPALVDRLPVYFNQTAPEEGQPVFPLKRPGGGMRATSKMMKHDCKVAGIPYRTDEGYVDFHALRVLFITSLCRINVGLVTAQKLARHSDPKLTSNTYSKVSPQERAEAVGGISFETPGFFERHTGIENCSAIGSAPTANPGKMGLLLAAPKNPVVRTDQKEALCNPLKSHELAQKKPAASTTGRVDRGGLEPPTPGFSVCDLEDVTLDSQPLTQTQNSSSSASGSALDEPASQIASDAILADLIGDGTAALDSILTPDIRFVVNQWPDLPEDTQRAILAIVRAAISQAGRNEQNRPAPLFD
jgi:Phage integrase family